MNIFIRTIIILETLIYIGIKYLIIYSNFTQLYILLNYRIYKLTK